MNQSCHSHKSQEDKLKHLKSLTFRPPILSHCTIPQHQFLLLEAQHICLKASCKNYTDKFCSLCSHPPSHLYSIKKVVPVLSKFIQDKWEQIRSNGTQIQKQWRICQVNIKYCIDILQSVLKTIVDSKNTRLKELPVYENMIDIVLDMHREGAGFDHILRNLQNLNNKYGLFERIGKNHRQVDSEDEKYKCLDGHCIEKDIEFRNLKWFKAGEQTKIFSQKALAFSENLAQLIQDRLKYEKRKHNIENLTASKIATLKQILYLYNNDNGAKLTQKIESISCLKIEFNQLSGNDPKSAKMNSTKFFEEKLNICVNLSSLLINNKNGKITSDVWQPLTAQFENLHHLKQLKLHLRYEDLLLLTQLFKQKPKRVRNISVLYLTINDEPNLDMKMIAEFCNTLQLSELSLTLARDNITKINFFQFLTNLRYRTSLSFLPMNILDLNLSKNKIHQKQIPECERKFMEKYTDIKKKTIIF